MFIGLSANIFVPSDMGLREEHNDQVTIPKAEHDRLLQLEANYEFLRQELANLKRMLFGSKSERHVREDPS